MEDAAGRPLELMVFERTPQLLECSGLDLPHPLARDTEVLACLRQRARHAVIEAVADAEDLLLALTERAQQSIELLVLELDLHQALDRRRGFAEILARELLERLQAGAFVERAQSGDQGRQALRAGRRDPELGRDLVHPRLAAETSAER